MNLLELLKLVRDKYLEYDDNQVTHLCYIVHNMIHDMVREIYMDDEVCINYSKAIDDFYKWIEFEGNKIRNGTYLLNQSWFPLPLKENETIIYYKKLEILENKIKELECQQL